jgi:Mn-dependent DtxR family transcriptional regulator
MVSNCESVYVFSGGDNDTDEFMSYAKRFNTGGVVSFADLVAVIDVEIASTNTAVAHLKDDGMIKVK